MRTSLTALLPVLLLGAPAASFGETILFSSSDESRIEYGTTGLIYDGLPSFSPLTEEINGVERTSDWEVTPDAFQVFGGFVGLALETDGNGQVVRSTYYYRGLPFEMSFLATNFNTGETRQGQFKAPIVGLIEVVVEERPGPEDDFVQISFELGRGVFDEPLARALKIHPHTAGGRVFDPYLVFGDGGPDSPERRAWEGASDLTIDVAEPASLSLVGVAAVGVIRRARKSRSLSAKRTSDA
jgi:hypothetical protein